MEPSLFKTFMLIMAMSTSCVESHSEADKCLLLNVAEFKKTGVNEVNNAVINIQNNCNKDYYLLLNPSDFIQFDFITTYDDGQKSHGIPDYFGEIEFSKITGRTSKRVFSNLGIEQIPDSAWVGIRFYEEPNVDSKYVVIDLRLK